MGRPYCTVVFSITGMEERFNKEGFSESQHPYQESNMLCRNSHSAFSNPYTNGILRCMFLLLVLNFHTQFLLSLMIYSTFSGWFWRISHGVSHATDKYYFWITPTVLDILNCQRLYTILLQNTSLCNMYTWSPLINFFSLFCYYRKIPDKRCSRKKKFVFVHI